MIIEENIINQIFKLEHSKGKKKRNEFIIKNNDECYIGKKIYILLRGVALMEIKEKNVIGESFFSLIPEMQLFCVEHLLSDTMKINLNYKVMALTDVDYLEIDADYFLDHVYINPKVYHKLLEDIISRYFMLTRSFQFIHQNPKVKMGNGLFDIARILNLKPTKLGTIIFPSFINQSFLSKYVKSSPANISRACLYLENKKIITRNPIVIKNQKKLEKIVFFNNDDSKINIDN